MAERVTNKMLLSEIQAVAVEQSAQRKENRTEHGAITEAISGCRERIGRLEVFREDTKPKINGLAKEVGATSARWKVLVPIFVGTISLAIGFVLKALVE